MKSREKGFISGSATECHNPLVVKPEPDISGERKTMKAIGKLVLGALLLAGATAAAPAAEAAGYGGYGHGPGWGRPGAHFSFGVGPSWRGGRWVHGWHGPRH